MAEPPVGTQQQGGQVAQTDELPNPAEEKRRELRAEAIQDVLQGR